MHDSRHTWLPHQLESDWSGYRYLFISPCYWFQGFDKDPYFQYFKPLFPIAARNVLEDVIQRDRQALWRVYEVSQRGRLRDGPDVYATIRFLTQYILDSDWLERGREPGRGPPHFSVLKEDRPLPKPPPMLIRISNSLKAAPLAATEAWIAVQCVDDSAEHKPVPRVSLELLTASGDVRHERTNDQGTALVSGIAPGRVVIRVLELDGSKWKALDGDAAQPSTTDERTKWHVVQQGECMSKIAHRFGLKSWEDIWEHPKNEALRKKRKSPHVLLPGDEVAVPQPRLHEIARETLATHRIEVKPAGHAELRIVLQDHNQLPFKNEQYELRTSPDQDPRTGSTDGEGRLIEQLPIELERVEVSLPRLALRWTFSLSKLIALPGEAREERTPDGKATTQAVKATQMRLNALGFPCGKVDGIMGPRTRHALALLQRSRQGQEAPEDEVELLALNDVAKLFTV